MVVNSTMSVAKYKKHAENLLSHMQFFCLDPDYDKYKEIIENNSIKNEQSEFIELWKLACITQYGLLWDLPNENIVDASQKFEKEMRNLYARLLMRPTATNLDRMWYVFFATGDINTLKAAFEVSGNESASQKLQIAASDQFANFRDAYKDKMQELLYQDPNYCYNRVTVPNDDDNPLVQAFTVFTRFQQQIDEATQKLADDSGDDLQGVLSRIGKDSPDVVDDSPVDEFMSDMFGDQSDEEGDRLKNLARKFDEVARDVLKDRYVTKESGEKTRRKK